LHDEQEDRGGEHSGGDVDRQAVPESDERETTRKSSVAYAAGLTIFFSVLSFMGLGWVLDNWLGTSWIMVTGIVLGAVVGFYEFIRIISKIK
jgi:F0F1-type ATP synthase assembly protein I